MQKLRPCLWFDGKAEEAMDFYASVFPDSKIGDISRYGDGSVLTASITIYGQEFILLNGGPQYKFTEATSFSIDCESQDEVDELWDKLTSDGGEGGRCGWLKDKFGVSWQIVPSALRRYLSDPDPQKAERALQAMLQMDKIVIADLERARDQG